ncbi:MULTISPECIES: flagellar motor protein MotB [Paenibacillus]|uniref:Flagellar motor protein n=2 Tax=Paenibacillus TaxID=44249 RepID=A0ABX2ZF09_PAEPO|nr:MULTISPECIES: flagellar motor protein MotB [Paenibacillus]MCP3745953.1 OmpA family protein [Paenibacillus sp. A3M_27_13]MDR6778936.1 chemotaxis protein MotB [Paenibacillus peoriae]ODA09578.1 flagellar motor protein [Paenibacillus polymyxa]OME67910.1 flagellar motor protein [Paenibacillus peoriae]
MRARGKRRGGQGGGGDHRDRWMITYADLITLLLIFFVVMYAMSSLDAKKYDVVVQSLQDTFHKGDSILEQGSGITGTADRYTSKNPPTTKQPAADRKEAGSTKLTEREQAFRTQEKELQNLMGVIQEYITDNKLENQIFVSDQPRGIVITLNDRFLFDQGRAALKQGSANTLSKLASLFRDLKTPISIEGHTDNIPFTRSSNSSTYKDNWELSGARALSVLRFFLDREQLSPSGFQYAGYADTRPVGDNSTEAGRQKNRRVEITVLRQLQQ